MIIIMENISSENCEYIHKHDLSVHNSILHQKNLVEGLLNARRLLEGLENSFKKTVQYENKLLLCKAAHEHSHADQWSSDRSDDKHLRDIEKDTEKLSRNPVEFVDSWSTMSIVCLQYQYEELSKRYESLLRAYHERCGAVSNRDASLARLRDRIRTAHAQLTHAHKSLISIGEKYISLWQKKQLQKHINKKKIDRMRAMVRGLVAMCEQARLELDNRIVRYVEKERNMPNAHLLSEIRKCNLLYLENLKLKALIEDLAPGLVNFG